MKTLLWLFVISKVKTSNGGGAGTNLTHWNSSYRIWVCPH